MTFEVTFDLMSILFLIIVPPVMIFLCKTAWSLSKEFIARRDLEWRKDRNAIFKEERDLRVELYDLRTKMNKED